MNPSSWAWLPSQAPDLPTGLTLTEEIRVYHHFGCGFHILCSFFSSWTASRTPACVMWAQMLNLEDLYFDTDTGPISTVHNVDILNKISQQIIKDKAASSKNFSDSTRNSKSFLWSGTPGSSIPLTHRACLFRLPLLSPGWSLLFPESFALVPILSYVTSLPSDSSFFPKLESLRMLVC